MVSSIVDICVVVLILGMTYALMSEGIWGAALQFFNSLFAALITLNFYEPAAAAVSKASFLSGYADALCILVIFSVSLLLLRLGTEALSPTMIRFPKPILILGSLFFGLGGAAVTMGVLLIALNASPVEKRMFGFYDYKYQPMYKYRLDKEILAFFQYTTGNVLSSSGSSRDPMGEYGTAKIFDPRGDWLIRSQQARPHGEGDILDEGTAAEGGAGAEGGGAATKGAGAEGGAPPAAGGRGAQPGPGIPGGTAGAAAGLAPTM